MKLLACLCGTIITANMAQPAACQQRGEADSATVRDIGYDATGLISPSSATSTISPSSVPQAMDKLAADGAVAELSLGTIYASGTFGTGSDTSIWSSALGARLRHDAFTLTASLPWMRIRSRSTIFTGIDATPVLVAPNTRADKRTIDGFGDLTLGAAYTIAPASSPVELELSGRAKLNTASKRSGLSSGENDYAVGADLSLPLGKITPFTSFTYRFLGNTATYTLRDGPAASAGASYALGTDTFLLASYHYARAATRQVADAHELFAGASTRIAGTSMRLTGFATAGLSHGAAGASAGIAISAGLGPRQPR